MNIRLFVQDVKVDVLSLVRPENRRAYRGWRDLRNEVNGKIVGRTQSEHDTIRQRAKITTLQHQRAGIS